MLLKVDIQDDQRSRHAIQGAVDFGYLPLNMPSEALGQPYMAYSFYTAFMDVAQYIVCF